MFCSVFGVLRLIWELACGESRESTPITQSSPICNLPDECTCRILVLLPVKEIIRCRAVCKAWNSVVQRAEIWRSVPQLQERWVWVLNPKEEVHSIGVNPISIKFKFKGAPKKYFAVLTSSMCGLVCGFTVKQIYYVGNPITRQWKVLPPLKHDPVLQRYGRIVVDEKSGHYRVFLFYPNWTSDCYDMFCSKSNEWSRVLFGSTNETNLEQGLYPFVTRLRRSVVVSKDRGTVLLKPISREDVKATNFVAVYDTGLSIYRRVKVTFPLQGYSIIPGIHDYKGKWFLMSLQSTVVGDAVRVPPGFVLRRDKLHLGIGVWEFKRETSEWQFLSGILLENIMGEDAYSALENMLLKEDEYAYPGIDFFYSAAGG